MTWPLNNDHHRLNSIIINLIWSSHMVYIFLLSFFCMMMMLFRYINDFCFSFFLFLFEADFETELMKKKNFKQTCKQQQQRVNRQIENNINKIQFNLIDQLIDLIVLYISIGSIIDDEKSAELEYFMILIIDGVIWKFFIFINPIHHLIILKKKISLYQKSSNHKHYIFFFFVVSSSSICWW